MYCAERSESKILENQISSVLLTMRRPRFERGSSITVFPGFFQMVGKEPFFSLLTAPSTWTDLSKESGEKWSEQTAKRPSGLKCARWVPTKAFHLARRVLSIGDLWREIPADISATLLHPCTTQRREGIALRETRK